MKPDGKKADHSDSDYGFAVNCRLGFYIPEQVFNETVVSKLALESAKEMHHSQLFSQGVFPLYKKHPSNHEGTKEVAAVDFEQYTLIICVGSPGSGKSTYIRGMLSDSKFTIISQDLLGTKSKCLAAAKKALADGGTVIVDNTNPKSLSRQEFINLNSADSKTLCLYFSTRKEMCIHNNKFRLYGPHASELFKVLTGEEYEAQGYWVPAVAIHSYWANLEVPSETEGMDVVEIPFVPSFENEFQKKIWSMAL
jgi:bifunctional polynucleotide phosphatase/kinase